MRLYIKFYDLCPGRYMYASNIKCRFLQLLFVFVLPSPVTMFLEPELACDVFY